MLSFPKISLRALFDKLNKYIVDNSFSLSSLYTIGIVLSINFIFGLIYVDLSYINILNMSFIITAFLVLVLLLNEMWGSRLKQYITDIWKFCLIFGLIFIPSYILFATEFHILWLCNFILSATLFIIMTDLVVGLTFVLIAGAIGYLLPKIFIYDTDLITIEFAVVACAVTLIAIVIQLYKRNSISKSAYEEIMQEVDKTIKERTAELKEALNVKSEFLNKLSHEIRTPMHNMFTLSEGLYSSWKNWSEKERKKFIKGVIDSKTSLMAYTSNILDLASLQQGQFTLDIKSGVDLVKLSKNVINEISPRIIDENKNLYVKLEVKASKGAIIECDEKRISQVIYNLLSNAIKYSDHGTIRLSIDAGKTCVDISISDEGIGIPKEERLKIFDPFFESSKTKSPAKGKGLGLSVAQKIIVLHKSTIKVEDNKPKGSVFKFSLPYRVDGTK